jgi:hypothetical protein
VFDGNIVVLSPKDEFPRYGSLALSGGVLVSCSARFFL